MTIDAKTQGKNRDHGHATGNADSQHGSAPTSRRRDAINAQPSRTGCWWSAFRERTPPSARYSAVTVRSPS